MAGTALALTPDSQAESTPLTEIVNESKGVIWNIGSHTCALSDSERHLGHTFRDGDKWLAYDAVHSNAKGTDFRFLGRYSSALDARRAIEKSLNLLVR
jgi:hypothetical protein